MGESDDDSECGELDTMDGVMHDNELHDDQAQSSNEKTQADAWQRLVLLRVMGRLLKVQRQLNPTLQQIASNSKAEDEALDALERYQFGRRHTDYGYDKALDETTEGHSIH